MEQATMAMTAQAMGENPGDETLLVRFFLHPVKDSDASTEAGRPIFRELEHIEIKSPGNRKSGVARVARTKDVERFPRHYAAFKNRMEGAMDGTPLSEWTIIPRSLVEEFAYFNIKTVENLANVHDGNALNHSSIITWREKAKKFLERAAEEADGQVLEALQVENASLQDQLSDLKAQVSALVTAQAEAAVADDGD